MVEMDLEDNKEVKKKGWALGEKTEKKEGLEEF